MGLDDDQQGVLIQQVILDTPADEAGLLGGEEITDINGQQVAVGGDVIVAADGVPIEGFDSLLAFMQTTDPGQNVTFTVLRDGAAISVPITLGERPATMP
jgi:S1-C subfamily serine protease